MKGFTLIELMIVILLIGILSAIAVPSYREYVALAHGATAMRGLTNNMMQVQTCISDNIGCNSLNLRINQLTELSASPSIIQPNTNSTLVFDEGVCKVSAIISSTGEIVYHADTSNAKKATLSQCAKGAGL